MDDEEFIDPNSDFGTEEFNALLEAELRGISWHITEHERGLHGVATLPRCPQLVEVLEAEYRAPGMYRMAITIDGKATDARDSTTGGAASGLIDKLKIVRAAYDAAIQRLEMSYVLASLDGTSMEE
jgi:hypothetical protein